MAVTNQIKAMLTVQGVKIAALVAAGTILYKLVLKKYIDKVI